MAKATNFVVNEKVIHPKWGEGVVFAFRSGLVQIALGEGKYRRLEYCDPDDLEREFKVGDRVVHENYGVGIIGTITAESDWWVNTYHNGPVFVDQPTKSEWKHELKYLQFHQTPHCYKQLYHQFRSKLTESLGIPKEFLQSEEKKEKPMETNGFNVGDRVIHESLGPGRVSGVDFTMIHVVSDKEGSAWVHPDKLIHENQEAKGEEMKNHRFKVGDRVVHDFRGSGVITKIDYKFIYIDLDSVDCSIRTHPDRLSFEDKTTEGGIKMYDSKGNEVKVGDRVYVHYTGPGELCYIKGDTLHIELEDGVKGTGIEDCFTCSFKDIEKIDEAERVFDANGTELKVGDWVKEPENETNTGVIKLIEGDTLYIKHDRGITGGGVDGCVQVNPKFTRLIVEELDEIEWKEGKGEVDYSKLEYSGNPHEVEIEYFSEENPFECYSCNCSFEGCPECTHDGIEVRKVEVKGHALLMYGVGDSWIPEWTYTGKFKLNDGRVIEIPDPQGEGWSLKYSSTNPKCFVIDGGSSLNLIPIADPQMSRELGVFHKEGAIWLGDMLRVLKNHNAQVLGYSYWSYEPPEREMELPYNYHCASRNELKGTWPTTGRPYNIIGNLKVEGEDNV